MKESQAFEERVRRIYELLCDSGAEVKWNAHIPDPDNPKQARQIDVTVTRDGILTLVECRHHKSRQDVQQIEELIGRKISLGAHAVIAVSSSGFTAGAIAKARKHGIWTFLDLSELEVPPFYQFRYWKQGAGQAMNHEAWELQFANEFQQLRVTGEGLKVTLRTITAVSS